MEHVPWLHRNLSPSVDFTPRFISLMTKTAAVFASSLCERQAWWAHTYTQTHIKIHTHMKTHTRAKAWKHESFYLSQIWKSLIYYICVTAWIKATWKAEFTKWVFFIFCLNKIVNVMFAAAFSRCPKGKKPRTHIVGANASRLYTASCLLGNRYIKRGTLHVETHLKLSL